MARHTFRKESASLSITRAETLESLSSKFDDLLDRMQTPTAKKGMEAAFNASPEALGRAAVETVKLGFPAR